MTHSSWFLDLLISPLCSPGFFKLSMSPKVAANLTCDPFWPQTLNDPPGSDFQELGLQIYTHVYHCLFMIFLKNYKTLLPC